MDPLFVIGVDPQLNVLAFKTVLLSENGEQTLICWFQEQMRRKDSFDKAEQWETYMIKKCDYCLTHILNNIKNYAASVELDITNKRVSLWVEQQRGRCKTIPEAALAALAHAYGIEYHIPHPATWKKGIGFSTARSAKGEKQVGNKANKNASVLLYGDSLKAYYAEQGFVVPKPDHHLCDAACLCTYGCLSLQSKC
jgi:hypothetical protein